MSGEKTAVQMAIAQADEPFTPEEQFDLLGLPETERSRQLTRQPKGRGRPPGALNKQTREWAEYLSRQFRHPLVTLAAIQAAPIDELAARLGCTLQEAMQEQRLAALALLPYMANKMPLAVNVNGKVLHLNILAGDEQLPVDDVLELMPEPQAADETNK